MGLITNFFITSKDELRSFFPAWLPVSESKNHPARNSLTGEIQLDWGPAPTYPSQMDTSGNNSLKPQPTVKNFISKIVLFFQPLPLGPLDKRFDVKQFAHYAIFNDVDIVKLAILFEILGGITFNEALNAWDKPALINPDSADKGLYAFPSKMTLLLSALTESEINQLSKKWANTEELKLDQFDEVDALEIVTTLKNLSLITVQKDKTLYLWWSL